MFNESVRDTIKFNQGHKLYHMYERSKKKHSGFSIKETKDNKKCGNV